MIDRIENQLQLLPRFALLAGETPLHELRRLSRSTGRRIFVKRDDLTGLAFGGNKVRQAEFIVGEALARGADTLVAGGSFAQSNHTRVLAAAARVAGLDSVVLVRPGAGPASKDKCGNALLTRLLGSDIRVIAELKDAPEGDRLAEIEFRSKVFDRVADELREGGRKPYVVLGSSTALGVMGYVAAAAEVYRQARRLDISFSKVFVTSLGATHAGLELGARLLGDEHAVVGCAYQPANQAQAEASVRRLIGDGADLLELDEPTNVTVQTDITDAGRQYGVTTVQSRKALRIAAHCDALILEPTYTAKGFATMLRWITEGRVSDDESILFIHTGGLPSLFSRSWRELSTP